MEVKILGVSVGQAAGWDIMDVDCLAFYDVDTGGVYHELDGFFTFNSTTGLFQKYDEDTGEETWQKHVFNILVNKD